jgi:hypothetical protein
MRYHDSVEDWVYEMLPSRLASIHALFGQLPDILEDVWILVAEKKIEEARQTINSVPDRHPFEIKYHKIEKVPWESCSHVLDASDRKKQLSRPW